MFSLLSYVHFLLLIIFIANETNKDEYIATHVYCVTTTCKLYYYCGKQYWASYKPISLLH